MVLAGHEHHCAVHYVQELCGWYHPGYGLVQQATALGHYRNGILLLVIGDTMKLLQRIIDAVFGLYTIKSPWTNHDVKTPEPPVVVYYHARVIFYHYRNCFVFERSIWRFLDVSFPREQTIADILRQTTRMYDPDIDDLFIHMRTNTEFMIPVDKLSDLEPLTDHGFTVLDWGGRP